MVKSHLRVVFGVFRPFAWEEEDDDGNIIYQGMSISPLLNVTSRLNISVELVPHEEGWGSRLDNGTYTGMLKMAVDDEVDIAAGPFAVNWLTSLELPASRVFGNSEMTFLSGHRHLFLTELAQVPFDGPVSLLLVVSCLLITVMFYLTLRTSPHTMTLWDSLYLSQSIFLQDPIDDRAFTTDSSRIVLAVWSFATMIIAQLVSGILRSMTAVKTPIHRLDYFDEIIDNPELRVYVYAGVGITNMIAQHRGAQADKLAERVQRFNGELAPYDLISDETMNSVLDGKAVIIMDKLSILGFFPMLCGMYEGVFHISEQDRVDIGGCWYYSRELDADTRHTIDRLLATSVEMKVPWVRDRDMFPNPPVCFTFAQQSNALGDSETFSLETLWPFILTWLVGCAGSSIVFLVEWIVPRLYRSSAVTWIRRGTASLCHRTA